MIRNNGRYRHELKYLLNLPEASLLESRIRAVMSADAHAAGNGEYTIRSLYFDDYFRSAYTEKDAGIFARKKYRIRIYNYSDDFISFERKIKNDQYIYKQSARLTRAQTDSILAGDYAFLEKLSDPFMRELYFELTSRILRPRVTVDYERAPYTMSAGDVRVTFDRHVRGSSGTDLFDPKLPATDALPADKTVVEVKFTEFLPSVIRRILPPRSSECTAVSKFILCCNICPTEGERFLAKAENSMIKPV